MVPLNPVSVTTGLSPRGRGNHRYKAHGIPKPRSIPAWAGQPKGKGQNRLVLGVYPRVGGQPTAFCWIASKIRVYPRVGRATHGSGLFNIQA